ncbi:MAG: hypothetical protein H7Z19_15380 [Chitinophagaceae bacterium]|nr:hypothetical protein [Rubrivivax sp.]
MHIAIWIIAAMMLGLWSLLAWGVAAVLGLGVLSPEWVGDIKVLIDEMPHADVIEAWLPGWQRLLVACVDMARSLLGWLGAYAPVLMWLVWGTGALFVLGTAAVLSLIVVAVRRYSSPPAQGSGSRATPA